MRVKSMFLFVIVMVFSLALMANSCDVDTKTVKLGHVDKSLKKYKDTKWDGLQEQKIEFAVGTGNKQVDDWSKQAAVFYASLVQAEHVVDVAGKKAEKLKKKKNSKAKKEAQRAVNEAEKILKKAADNAPKLIKNGEKLVADYKTLINNPTKLPAIGKALMGSLENLKQVIDRAPKTLKKLGKLSKKLAKI
ncbi:MAG: hypothetical protein P9L99_15230 [Candidatus Lernaella stagnicola]|nr:hypothetical protein [Candidatus Lernaella stagnicola]